MWGTPRQPSLPKKENLNVPWPTLFHHCTLQFLCLGNTMKQLINVTHSVLLESSLLFHFSSSVFCFTVSFCLFMRQKEVICLLYLSLFQFLSLILIYSSCTYFSFHSSFLLSVVHQLMTCSTHLCSCRASGYLSCLVAPTCCQLFRVERCEEGNKSKSKNAFRGWRQAQTSVCLTEDS